MNRRFSASLSMLTFAVMIVLLAPIGAAAQSGVVAVEKAAAGLAPKGWTAPRTPDGQPDISGLFTNGILTPLERPAQFAGKAFFTPQEAAAFARQVIDQRNADRRGTGDADVGRAYNDAWWDWGTKVAKTLQTSLVVDPPDGKIPPYTPEALKRIAAKAQTLKERCEHTVCPPALFGVLPADGPEDRSYMERCLWWSTVGPPMLPTAYNNNYQIVQTRDYVMIRIEMIHDVRIIPLDGRPHVDPSIRQFLGDSRGHWERNTLVVDTTNFNDDTDFRNAGRNMHLTERFTRVAPDTILYEFTVDDPTTFTKPWTGEIPMTKIDGPIYEYACHEGNYGLAGILAGARAKERQPAGTQ